HDGRGDRLLGQLDLEVLLAIAQRIGQDFVKEQAARRGGDHDGFEVLIQRLKVANGFAELVLALNFLVLLARNGVKVVHAFGAEDRALDANLDQSVEVDALSRVTRFESAVDLLSAVEYVAGRILIRILLVSLLLRLKLSRQAAVGKGQRIAT